MIHGHFFFDKMEKVEIRPLTPEEMLRSYVAIFERHVSIRRGCNA